MIDRLQAELRLQHRRQQERRCQLQKMQGKRQGQHSTPLPGDTGRDVAFDKEGPPGVDSLASLSEMVNSGGDGPLPPIPPLTRISGDEKPEKWSYHENDQELSSSSSLCKSASRRKRERRRGGLDAATVASAASIVPPSHLDEEEQEAVEDEEDEEVFLRDCGPETRRLLMSIEEIRKRVLEVGRLGGGFDL
ncbi:hypothetical protein BGZ83_001222 [Gryganskiella cystojenkinii]|nr:hypothetical protein BGZ83_001222 [Gryganskiella cystojenkinii]